MENNKKVPELRFKGFSEEWKQCELRNACTIKTGYPSDSIDFSEDGIFRVITNVNIQDNSATVDNSLGNRVNIYDKQLIEEYVLKTGDILVTMDGTVGRTAKVADHHMVLAQRVGRLIANGDTEFVYQLLNVGSFYKRMAITSVGGTIKHISLSDIGNYTTSIPTNYLEQKAIGNYFQNIDKLIETNQSKLDKLKNIKNACLEKMFPKSGATIPELRFKGFTEEWEEKTMGGIGNAFTGLTGKTKDDFGHGDAEFVTYMNVFANPIASRCGTEIVEIDNKQNGVKYGDVFFTTSSETPEEVGMSSVWLNGDDNIYLNSFCFGYRLNEYVYPYYMAYLLRSPSIRNKIAFLAQGISRYNISKNKVMEINLPLPNPEEQNAIGNYLKNLDDLISKTEQRLNKLKNIKKACLEKMFVNMEDTI